MGTAFTALRLSLHEVLIINPLFPPMHETLCAGRVKPSAEASGLYTHAVFQPVVRKTASSECILQWAKEMRVRGRMKEKSPPYCCSFLSCRQTGVRSGAVMQVHLIHIPVQPNPSKLFFSIFFSVCTYRSELNVAPLPKNYTNKVPLLSQ